MSDYVFGTSLSYYDFLQARRFEDTLRAEIRSNTRSIIASNEQLQREHITISSSTEQLQREQLAISEQMAASVSSGFEQLSFQMHDLSEGVRELNATFQWGISNLLTAIGTVNDSLQKLIQIAKTPAQTWAYEQFEVARDAFRQDLYDESLEYLGRAIGGFASNTGYKLEYRFHYLLGAIRLGEFEHKSPAIVKSVVNLGEAEQAFLNAARYAQRDHPQEAGRALLCAGRAAYCQGNFADAQKHLEAAIALHPTLGEAHFQLAKVLMHVGASEEALTPLRSAIDTDRNYALRAGSDGDFQAHQDKVDGLLYSLREEAKQIAQASLISVNHKYDATEKICVGPFSLPKYTDLEPVKGTIEKAIHEADSNAYFGYLNAEQECRRASELISQSVLHFAAGAKKDCNVQLTDIAHRIDACHIDTSLGVQMSTWSVMIIGFVVSWSAGTRGCTHYPYPWTGFGQWIGTMFVGLLLSGGCAFGLGLLIKTYAERETRRDRAKLRLEEEEKFRHFAEELDRHERAES